MAKAIQKDVVALGAVLAAVDGLEAAQQRWVFAAALSNLGLSNAPLAPLAPAGGGAAAAPLLPQGTDGLSAKDFLRTKNPQSDVQRVVCLAYYLLHYRQQPYFKTKDLTTLNIEAAGTKIGNPSQAVNNATKQNDYLAAAGGGKKQISSFGEQVVEALPDQASVRDVERNKPKKRKGGKRRVAKADRDARHAQDS